MGFRRGGKDQHQRKGIVPKVTLVGSIDATCADHAAVIDFKGDHVLIRFPNYRAAGKMQQTVLPNPVLLARVLRFSEQAVFIKIGSRKEIEVFPKPSWIIRVLSPQLRRFLKA